MTVKVISGEYQGKIGLSLSGYCNNRTCFYNVTLTDHQGKEFTVSIKSTEIEQIKA